VPIQKYSLNVLTIDNSSYGVWKGSAFTDPVDLNNPAVSAAANWR